MGDELKPCPFCGDAPLRLHGVGGSSCYAACQNGDDEIGLCNSVFYPSVAWNRRPVEDALTARAEAAEQRAEAAEREVARLRVDAVALVDAVLRADRLPDADVVEVMRRVVRSEARKAIAEVPAEAQPAEVTDG